MAFEAILSDQRTKPRSWRRIMLALSVALHALALLGGVAHSMWQVEEMPLPSLQVTLTAALPPPPPPPPPARKKSPDSKPKVRPVAKPQELVVPKDTPKEEPKKEPEAAADDGESDDPAGQPGGVLGGVVGGVVGAAPPPVAPKPTGPKLVSAQIARGQLLIDPNAERYRVKLPPPLARSGETYVAMLRICVSAQGSVSGVQLMKGASPAIDSQFPSVIGRWRYRPLLADGQPTPFCYLLRYEVTGR